MIIGVKPTNNVNQSQRLAMCLILFSYKKHKKYKLILAANRDEFYARPTEPISRWNKGNGIIAGKDLEAGGTWMGISENGHFAALTNFRDPKSIKKDVLSRGLLVSNFLEGKNDSPEDYLNHIAAQNKLYNGFNLLAGDRDDLYYFSNHEGIVRKIEPGLHGLSNHLLDTPWPKVEKGKKYLERLIDSECFENHEKIFAFLEDSEIPPDQLLPETGMGIDWERMLAPLFIKSDIYGTRSSSFLLIGYDGKGIFTEKTWIKTGGNVIPGETRVINF